MSLSSSNFNPSASIQGSRLYADNKYLTTIFQKQQRLNRPIQVQQTDTPYHFMKKNLTQEQKRQLLQKKIFDNPELYISTHVKCQICNKYISVEETDRHSRVHFEEEERIAKILERGRQY